MTGLAVLLAPLLLGATSAAAKVNLAVGEALPCHMPGPGVMTVAQVGTGDL